uniref:OTU domain-containing protein n=1 Tax=Meloidogyne enterolobii TaxID=390850 RepID=A0A6V7X0J9_MELEN|nr:unnamed protein product [Meloidogyne enterolobii]
MPVVVGGNSLQQFDASVKNVELFKKNFVTRKLHKNQRLEKGQEQYRQFLKCVGTGVLNDEEDRVRIPAKMHTNSKEELIDFVFPHELLDNSVAQWKEICGRAILCPLNNETFEINNIIMDRISGQEQTYYGITTPIMSESAEDELVNNISDVDYENLIRLTPAGVPEHTLRIKVGAVMMLLINLSVSNGLCNGTRLQVVRLGRNMLYCRVLTGSSKGNFIEIFRTRFLFGGDPKAPREGMLRCERIQFPLRPGAAMTINKAQGQTLSRVGIVLNTSQCFSHGHLYVALSRARDVDNVLILTKRADRRVKNPVVQAIIDKDDFDEIGPIDRTDPMFQQEDFNESDTEEPVTIVRIPHSQNAERPNVACSKAVIRATLDLPITAKKEHLLKINVIRKHLTSVESDVITTVMQSNLENKIHDEILRACQPEMDMLLEAMQSIIENIGVMNYGDVIHSETFGELQKIAKVIVHMFAPQVIGSRSTNEDKLALTACCSKALDIMREKDFTSISFPCGAFLYPRGEAAKIIVESLLGWISRNEDYLPKLSKIFLVVPSRNDELLYKDSLEKAKSQLRITAKHSIQQDHIENICDNAHNQDSNIPRALLDNVMGDGDCLFRSIIRALHGGSERQDLQNDQQQTLRRLIARSYQRDIARATDEEVAILVNEVEWNAEHIQRAGLLLDELNPRDSLRRYSIHMMHSSNYDDTRWGSHLEVRYAEIVLNRNIMIVENRRELVGNVWRELDGVYEAIFLGNNEINVANMGLARFTDYSQIFDVLRQINLIDVIVLRRSGSHYRPIYMHPMDEQQRQTNLNLLENILQDVPDEPWNE